MPAELTKALEGLGGALGGLAGMVGDEPRTAVDTAAVEREAAEAAAKEVQQSVQEAERQVSGDRPRGLPAPEPAPLSHVRHLPDSPRERA